MVSVAIVKKTTTMDNCFDMHTYCEERAVYPTPAMVRFTSVSWLEAGAQAVIFRSMRHVSSLRTTWCKSANAIFSPWLDGASGWDPAGELLLLLLFVHAHDVT